LVIVSGQSCTSTTCGTGLSCCEDQNGGASCYDPTQYSCLPTGSGGEILCGWIGPHWYPAQVCGDQCYDQGAYSCCNGVPYNILDPRSNPCLYPPIQNPLGCSSDCYTPNDCCDIVNAGPSCYDPTSYLCFNLSGSQTPGILCAYFCLLLLHMLSAQLKEE